MNNFIIKEGDILRIRSDLSRSNKYTALGINEYMELYKNEKLEVRSIDGSGHISFKDVCWAWERMMIAEIIKGTKNEQVVEETRDYIEFKIGDKVLIRSKEELEKIYGRNELGIKTYIPFTTEMETFCGKKAKIRDIYGKFVTLEFSIEKRINQEFTFTLDMIEISETKEDKKKMEREIDEQDKKIIEEMIGKVDIQKFKKILASAFKIPGTKLAGIDQILHNWAVSKKNLYKLLGNKIKVSKSIEYNADEQYWGEQRRKLAQEFPGIGYMLLDMNIRCFEKNIYVPFSKNIDSLMKDAKEGMKLTTFLSNAFNNSDFDTSLSKIIDSAKVSGNIVISIDPVDFLTMSFNQSGWCSCHTIAHDGASRNFGDFVRRYI